MLRKLSFGLLIAAAVSGPLYAAYAYFEANYVIMTKETSMQIFMMLMSCMAGGPR